MIDVRNVRQSSQFKLEKIIDPNCSLKKMEKLGIDYTSC